MGISYGLLESVRTKKLIGIKGSPYKLSKFVRISTSAVPVARKCVASGLDFGDFVEKWGSRTHFGIAKFEQIRTRMPSEGVVEVVNVTGASECARKCRGVVGEIVEITTSKN